MKTYTLYLITFILSCKLLPLTCSAQTNVPPPHVINAAGGSVKITGGNYYGYNIGEPIVGTGGNYYTQGFLQPNYTIGTAFNASIYYFNESCQGANDGSVIANVYNNKGTVHYSLTGGAVNDSTSASHNLMPGTYTLTIVSTTTLCPLCVPPMQNIIRDSIFKVITIAASTDICPVSIHNAFSPNGDGLNDLFSIDGIENYPDNHVYIFNRYGQQLWDAAHYDNSTVVWNGRNKNNDALYAGTYFYIIEIDSKKPMKGWVEITSTK